MSASGSNSARCELRLAEGVDALRRAGLVVSGPAGSIATGAVGAVRVDSRQVLPGDCFVAYRGVATDGHAHVPAALSRGAALVLVEDHDAVPLGAKVPCLVVSSGRAAWAVLAAHACGNPQEKLTLLGITGTNGKTSTVWMTAELLRAAGVPCLTIGTLGANFDGSFRALGHTTPDPDRLYPVLAEAVSRGIRVVAMEVSSHAVSQEKLRPMRFDAAAFTSFSRDHLDFHVTMDAYWDAKWHFVRAMTKPDARFAFCDGLPLDRLVLNGSAGARSAGETWFYGLDGPPKADFSSAYCRLTVDRAGFPRTRLTVATPEAKHSGEVPYFARHALENFLAALLVAGKVLGRLPDPKTWPTMKPVPGRLEQVSASSDAAKAPAGPAVVVDYAHTPDALEKTLQVLRPLCRGKLRVVFGCGGDRDRGKRPLMGGIAQTLADAAYVTSDNPRTEDPDKIIEEIVQGMQGTFADGVRPIVNADRAAAINRAIADAAVLDMVLIAGKGHEAYQIIGTQTLDFDDRVVALAALNRRSQSAGERP